MTDRARKLTVTIVGDANQLTRAFGQADVAAGGFGSKMAGVGRAVAAGMAVAAAAIIGIGVGLFNIGATFDEASDKISVQTGATGEALAGLEESFKTVFASVPTDADSAATAIATLNQRLGATGQPLEDLSAQMLELSRITDTDLNANLDAATGFLNNWEVSAGEAPDVLDQLFRVSQATGASFDSLSGDLAANGVTLRAVGLDIQESAAMFGLLAQNGLAVSDVMPAFNKAMATAAEQGITAEEALSQTWASIANAPNDIAAAQAAIDTFGNRAGPRMAELIRQGKLGYDELAATISAGGDTIMGAGDRTKDFSEQWTLFKNQVMVALAPLAEQVFSAVGDAMEALGPHVARLSEWLEVNLPRATARLQEIWATWGPRVRETFDRVSSAVSTAMGVVQTVIDRVSSFFDREGGEGGMAGTAGRLQRVISQMGDTFSSVFAAIQVAVTKTVEVVQALWSRFGESLLSRIRPFLDGILRAIEGALTFIQGLFDFFSAVFTGKWGKAWEAIKTMASGAWEVVRGLVEAGWQGLLALWDVITGTLDAAWDATWNGVRTLVSDTWAGITSTVAGGIDSVVGFFTGLPGRISSAVSGMWDGIVTGFKGAINGLIALWNNLSFTLGGGTYDPLGDWGPAVSVPAFTFDTPNVAFLASGGIVRAPTLAMMGEGGRPEAVAPLDDLVSIIRGAVATASPAGDIVVRLGDAELARVHQAGAAAARRRGF